MYQRAGGQGGWLGTDNQLSIYCLIFLVIRYLKDITSKLLCHKSYFWSNTLGSFLGGCFCSTVARLSPDVTHDPYIWQNTRPGLVKGFPGNVPRTTVLYQTHFHHEAQQTPAYVPRHSLTHALESELTCTQTYTLWGHRKGWELPKRHRKGWVIKVPQEGLSVIKAVLRPKHWGTTGRVERYQSCAQTQALGYHRKGWEWSKLCSDLSAVGPQEGLRVITAVFRPKH